MVEAARALELVEDEPMQRVARALRRDVNIAINVHSEHNFWTGLTMNISEGGVFFATHAHLPVGTLLMVVMALPFGREPVSALTEVRWTRGYSAQSDVPPGVGLRFVVIDPTAVATISRFTQTVREPLFYDE